MRDGKKLLLVSFLEPWSMGAGMGAPSLYETLRGYTQQGWQVHYVTSSKRSLGGGSHEKDIPVGLDGVTVHRFELPAPLKALGARLQGKADRLYLYPKYAANALREKIPEIGPAFVYAYEEGAVLAVAKLQREGTIDVPVLHRFQGTILGDRYKHWPTVLRKAESWLALRERADLYVMTDDGTQGDRALYHWNKSASTSNTLFIRNGIDKGIAGAGGRRSEVLSSFGVDPKFIVLMMISRLAGWKRVDRGIDLIAALKMRYPSLRLVVVGDGESRDELESYAKLKGVSDRVFFLGAQSRADVKLLLNASDLFLSLCDISNCGNPLFEALLCGRAVVTLNNGATGEVIRHGVNGLLLRPDDSRSLQNAISDLVERPELRAKLEHGAYRWAAENLYSWEERMQREVSWVEARLGDENRI